MKKILLLALLGVGYSYCYDVKLNNKTPHQIRFIIKSIVWKCKDGDLLVESGQTKTFNFKHQRSPCTRITCPTEIVANIGVSNNKVVQLSYEVGETTVHAGEILSGGFSAAGQVANPMTLGGAAGAGAMVGAVILAGSAIAAAGAGLYEGISKAVRQCHDMTITVGGDGEYANNYNLNWQWGLK